MSPIELTCRICGSEKGYHRFTIDGYPIYRCEYCSVEFIGARNADNYAVQKEAFDHTGFSNQSNKGVLRYWQNEAKIIQKLKPDGGRILDIGCNDGLFLSQFNYRWDKFGIELGENVAAIARSRGVEVTQRPLEQCTFEEGFFDVVTLYMIIEHLDHPKDAVSQITQWLKPDGVVVILTGVHDTLKARLKGAEWMMYTPPIHQWFFSKDALIQVINHSGLSVVKKKYTYGGVTESKSGLTRKLEHAIGLALSVEPFNQLGIYDHLFLYAKRT